MLRHRSGIGSTVTSIGTKIVVAFRFFLFLPEGRASVVIAGEAFASTAKDSRLRCVGRETRLFRDALCFDGSAVHIAELRVDLSFSAVVLVVGSVIVKASFAGRLLVTSTHHLLLGRIVVWERKLEEGYEHLDGAGGDHVTRPHIEGEVDGHEAEGE